ncbi:MAG: hypothetical protein ACLBM4_05410, partial [Dolichospermum sp.]
PLYRLGIPIYDRLGNGLFTKVGYRGTIELLFGMGNLFIEHEESSMMNQWSSVINKYQLTTDNQQRTNESENCFYDK